MKLPLRTLAIATSSVAIATLLSLGGLSLSINKAEAATRVYITTPYGKGWLCQERPCLLVRREGVLLGWPLEWLRVELRRLG
jgi:hypothetical protein